MTERAPDKTARIIRSAAASGEPRTGFVWPAPPYYEYVNGPARSEKEPCLLVYRDGREVRGELHAFLPDSETLVIRHGEREEQHTIGFPALREVRLLRAAPVRRQNVRFDAHQIAGFDRQPFEASLADGARIAGETLGHVRALCGLFLFEPAGASTVARRFVPARTLVEFRIGAPLGRLLIDENLASQQDVDAALEKQAALRSRRLGEYLTENQIVSQEQLAAALRQQAAHPEQKLGATLVQLGFLTPAELGEALAIQAGNRAIPLGQILTDMGVVDTEVVNRVLAKKLGIPFINLQTLRISPDILKRIPAVVANRYQVVPIAEVDNALAVAMEDPLNPAKLEELRFIAGTKLVPVMAAQDDLRRAVQRHYGAALEVEGAAQKNLKGMAVEELTMRLAAETGDVEVSEQLATQADSTLVRLVNKIILDAAARGASDIHIETNSGGRNTRIRFRKDGVLVPYLELPARFSRALISRIKIMSQLDITEHRKPQDGKIEFSRFGPAQVELRVATVPTSNGMEDVVLRVLAAASAVAMEELGFEPSVLLAIKRLIARPTGLFLVCGPTGSGKTTTLHSLLAHLNTPERKIWTAEDPIEISQPGLRQVQMNPKIGWTFAAALRSFMRADPDIIMVGEMRDAETAKIGIEASLTGHLVLSTLHTNSAPESVVRLLDLGMDPFNFADALLGVLSQRLVRRLCLDCRQAYLPPDGELQALAEEYCLDTPLEPAAILASWRTAYGERSGKVKLYRAKGCESCERTGYRGQMALHELLVVDANIKRLVQKRSPVSAIAEAAMAKGMKTLKQDGIAKVLQGHTDIREVRTV